jgi:regulator of nonsense transcripts 3
MGTPSCYIILFRIFSELRLKMTQPGKPTAGVLQIPVAATQKSGSGAPPKKTPKPPAPRLKLLIRRLPPGLTQTELETALGDEWKAGAGKVDWLQYKPGKVSKEYDISSHHLLA